MADDEVTKACELGVHAQCKGSTRLEPYTPCSCPCHPQREAERRERMRQHPVKLRLASEEK